MRLAHTSAAFALAILALGTSTVLVPLRPAAACPFCGTGSQAMSATASAALADAVVSAKVLGRKLVFTGESAAKPVATFEVLKLSGGEFPPVGHNFQLTAPRGAIGDATQAVLMLTVEGKKIALIDAYPDPSGRLFEYVVASKDLPRHDFAKRVAFYCRHLESDNPEIADDAQRQFADIPWEALREAKAELPVDKVREWLASDKVPAMRKGLYGLMLGTAGDKADAGRLERTLDAVQDNAVAAGGVLAGLCLLDGPGKLGARLAAVLSDAKRPAACREGVVGVVRFLWEDAQKDPARRAEMLDVIRAGLKSAEAAPAFVAELAAMGEHALTDEVKAYWTDPKRLTGKGRMAVFRYRDSLPKDRREAFRKFLADNPVSVQ
jgi:hypothetical protein